MMPIIIYRIKDIFSPLANTWDKLAPTEEQAINFAHTYINQEPERIRLLTGARTERQTRGSSEMVIEPRKRGSVFALSKRRTPSCGKRMKSWRTHSVFSQKTGRSRDIREVSVHPRKLRQIHR